MCCKANSCCETIKIQETVEAAGTTISNVTINIYYLLMRIVFAIVIAGITIWSLVDDIQDGIAGIWIFYVTHWGLIINSIYICSVSILHFKIYQAIKEDIKDNDNDYCKSIDELNLRFLWNWTLFWLDLSVALAVFIIFLYWVIEYDGGDVKPISCNTHGTVGVLIIIEWITSTWQLRYRGALIIFVVCVAWIICSIIFWVSGTKIVIAQLYFDWLYVFVNVFYLF